MFQVTLILRKNEFNKEFTQGSIKSYDSNQLASNDPIEDTRAEGVCTMSSGKYKLHIILPFNITIMYIKCSPIFVKIIEHLIGHQTHGDYSLKKFVCLLSLVIVLVNLLI